MANKLLTSPYSFDNKARDRQNYYSGCCVWCRVIPHSCENKAISAPSWGLAGWSMGWARQLWYQKQMRTPHIEAPSTKNSWFFFENMPSYRDLYTFWKLRELFENIFFSSFLNIPNFVVKKYSEIKIGCYLGDEEGTYFF